MPPPSLLRGARRLAGTTTPRFPTRLKHLPGSRPPETPVVDLISVADVHRWFLKVKPSDVK